MNALYLWLILNVIGYEAKTNKRVLINDVNRIKNDSFDVNIGAGYGVQSENLTQSDSQSQESNRLRNVQLLPSPYQVYEFNAEANDNPFKRKYEVQSPPPSIHRPNYNSLQNVVNNLEYGQKMAKIIEVLRVPAIYEVHLQSDNPNFEPQRYINFNPWLGQSTKLHRIRGEPEYYQPKINYQTTTSHGGSFYNLPTTPLYPSKPYVYKPPKYLYNPPPLRQPLDMGSIKNFWKTKNFDGQMYKKPQAIHEVPAPNLVNFRRPTIKPDLVYGQIYSTAPPPQPTLPTILPTIPTIWIDSSKKHLFEYPKNQDVVLVDSDDSSDTINSDGGDNDIITHNLSPNYAEINQAVGNYLDQNIHTITHLKPVYDNGDKSLDDKPVNLNIPESLGNYLKNEVHKDEPRIMYPRPFSRSYRRISNYRPKPNRPLDYIILIKEKTYD